MIDPATSFANALSQGLGIMKSYRDEARLDEDRAFDRQIRLRAEGRLDEAIDLQKKQDAREQRASDFEYLAGPDGISRAQKKFDQGVSLNEANIGITQANLKERQFNTTDEVLRENRQLYVEDARAGIGQKRAAATASYASAERQRAETKILQDSAAEEKRQKASMTALQAIVSGNADIIKNSPAVAPLVGRMAAQTFKLPSLLEALENPNGSWVNNARKVSEVFSFSNVSIKRTAERKGISPVDVKISRPRTSTRTVDGKTIPVIEFEVKGKDARTGEMRSETSYVQTDRLLDAGYVAAKSFRELQRRPEARGELVDAVMASDRELANDLVSARITQLQDFLKGQKDRDRSPAVSSARIELGRLTGSNLGGEVEGSAEYNRLVDVNKAAIRDVIFNGLGRAFR